MSETKIVRIETGAPYEVKIGEDLLSKAGKTVAALCKKCERVALVSDDRVYPLYGGEVTRSLQEAGFEVLPFVFQNGEESKTTDTLVRLLNFLAENGLSRTDAIAALGGGVTGDMAGLAASLYLRGIPFIQIPTTLLAAVDSSVGGKTAVDLPSGKNLVGSFYQPGAVLCDTRTLHSLSQETFAGGMAETIKYGLLCDENLFAELETFKRGDDLSPVVARCVELKNDYVARDERDFGKRQFLNLGHTPAHAIETLSNFTVPHGQAVAIGMAVMARASEALGLAEEPFADRLCALLRAQELPTQTEFDAESMAKAALSDKKRRGGKITLVLPRKIGKCELHEIPTDELRDFFAAGLAERAE